jgi:hypothetical protein
LSWLYSSTDFAVTTGKIMGKVLRRTGLPLLGGNVVAVQVTRLSEGGLVESRQELVSVVSDFRMTGDGQYEIPGLTPGEYVVFLEPLDPSFVEASGVGPYEDRPIGFAKDYYNGADESAADDPLQKVTLTVQAGRTVTEVNLVANELVNRLDLLTDDGEMTYEFPAGFRFPFFGKVYTEVAVNSDGNLTFSGGDGIPGEPRTESRFLRGLPRVAPLFTDLDPTAGGAVSASFTAGEMTFTWDGVPEFSDFGKRPGNKFSVSLQDNGNIRFKYQEITVTPDDDSSYPSQGLQVVAGITPGRSTSGKSQDLSAAAPMVRVADAPIYEVYPGQTFDLANTELLFATSSSELFFPFYRGDSQSFSGYAVTNFAAESALLQFEGRDAEGALLPFLGNPHLEQIEPGKQIAKLGSEFFGISHTVPQSGWIRAVSSTPEVGSFFQFGNGMSGPLTKMDGSIALTSQSKTLFFTRLYDGDAVVPALQGAQNAVTYLSVANPNAESIRLRFRLYGLLGNVVAPDIDRTLPAYGVLFESVHALFGVGYPISDGHVRVDVIQGPGAVGFEMIELADTLMGLNAVYGNSQTISYSAQMANGTAGNASYFTSLKVVNTSSLNRFVTITAYGSQGGSLGPIIGFTLPSNQSFQRDAGTIFGLGPAIGAATVGSIVVSADGDGVIGDVVFGEPNTLDYAAALPLQTVLFKKAVFSQVANGTLDPANPSLEYFTGNAFFNPNDDSAKVTVKVFSRDGVQVGDTYTTTLEARQRLSDLVANLVPGAAKLMRGSIRVESTQPLVAQQLFGNGTLKFLSAVPPRVIE